MAQPCSTSYYHHYTSCEMENHILLASFPIRFISIFYIRQLSFDIKRTYDAFASLLLHNAL